MGGSRVSPLSGACALAAWRRKGQGCWDGRRTAVKVIRSRDDERGPAFMRVRVQDPALVRPCVCSGEYVARTRRVSPVRIVLQPLNSAKTHEVLGSIEWTNLVSRAERSAGRMCLDVLVFSGGEGFQYHVIPLRSNQSTLHDGLRALADELPPDVEHWDEDFVIDRFQRFVDLNDEEGELVEVH